MNRYAIQFNLAFSMLEEVLLKSDEQIWNQKVGGHVFWQQLLHTLMGTHFWFRQKKEPFDEPFKDRHVYPELEQDPETILSKEELILYKDRVKEIVNKFFHEKDDVWFKQPSVIYPKLTNYEIMSMQIRHIMYHVGYCNALLKENQHEPVKWLDYFGEEKSEG